MASICPHCGNLLSTCACFGPSEEARFSWGYYGTGGDLTEGFKKTDPFYKLGVERRMEDNPRTSISICLCVTLGQDNCPVHKK